MGTSGWDRLAWPGPDLTPLEEQMVANAAAGKLVDRGVGPFNLAEMQAWGEDRTIRSVVLRHLLVAEHWPVDVKGVRLRGVRISGRLDLEGAVLRCPLLMDCCYLDANEAACLDLATASRITVTGCQLAGLTGEMLTARELDLGGSTLSGPLRLVDADITGRLSCRSTQLAGTDSDGNALDGDRLKVGGDVFLDGGLTAAGAVRLGGADITGQLSCHGARLTGTDSDGNALVADKLKVGGSVFLNEVVTIAGMVWLGAAEITGQLNCRGAQLAGTDSEGSALFADGLQVGSDVLLDEGFTTAGAIRLIRADIGGQLNCCGAQLTGHNHGYALFADGMKTGGDVSFSEGFTAVGAVWLAGADIGGQLSCRGAQLTGHDNDGNALRADWMKVGSNVFLDGGFTTDGAVRLDDANIRGQLSCSGAQLTSHNDGYALLANRLRTGGDVFLDKGFTAAGAVWLPGAGIAGRLVCSSAQLTGHNDGDALVAEAIKVDGGVFLDGGFTATGTVNLTAANIGGLLGCSGAYLSGGGGVALLAHGIKATNVFLDKGFTAVGTVQLTAAEITGRLSCRGAKLTGHDGNDALLANGIRIGGDLVLDGEFTTVGAVQLTAAEITGQLSCRGAQLTGHDSDGNALRADGMKAYGGVYLDDGFTAAGVIVLINADITGQLNCSGAQLTGHNSDGNALRADGLKVCGTVFLDDGLTAAGAILLPAVEITGQLSCRGAHLTSPNNDGYVLRADGMNLSGDWFLDAGFTAAGSISLRSARIAGSLDLGGNLDAGRDETALYAAVAQITGTLRWHPAAQVRGEVNLEGAAVGELNDSWTSITRSANGFWPTAGRLRLDGFTYSRLGGNQQANMGQRLDWIRSQYRRSAAGRTGFATQPYEQLATVYRHAGQDTQARKIAIARRADLRKQGNVDWYRRFGNWFLDWSIKYGYQSWRAGIGLAAVFGIFLVLTILAQHQHLFVPVGDIPGLHFVPSATRCTKEYPCFYPFGYAVDTVIPLLNVHQADIWGPDGSSPWGRAFVVATWIATGLGWALATLLVAGYTGLVRRD